ncbi:recombination regulator RecX [Poriferisphaera corsica]|uniref:Regulatory protein RecX n=1 Tax=Poriferisphaera corsica TaxID=2528020 RepID=A0A517YQF3_9BACT|nr:regulatory protein RecX [Poriferisphaera corsica]QDU32459.1 recombination regulator RecX [Poriferisphaera corsica]
MDEAQNQLFQGEEGDLWGKITAIAPTKRDPHRAMVKVDGKVFATMTLKLITDLDLKVGMRWTDELRVKVESASVFDKAFRSAMRSLSRRPMSEWEVRKKIREKGFETGAADMVVERLYELKLLDDDAFGRMLIRDLMGRKAAGPGLIRQKCFEKGLGERLTGTLIEEFAGKDDQVEAAVRFAEKKLRGMMRVEPVARKRRLYGALARRGYGGDVVSEVMGRFEEQISMELEEGCDF